GWSRSQDRRLARRPLGSTTLRTRQGRLGDETNARAWITTPLECVPVTWARGGARARRLRTLAARCSARRLPTSPRCSPRRTRPLGRIHEDRTNRKRLTRSRQFL